MTQDVDRDAQEDIHHVDVDVSMEQNTLVDKSSPIDASPANAHPGNSDESVAEELIEASHTTANKIVLNLLNEALAGKVVGVLRYRRHFFSAQGLAADVIKKEFLLHAEQEQVHADRIAKRILELGGEPNFNPRDLSSPSHHEYAAGKELENMIREDLLAEHGKLESYREMTTYLADQDPATRCLLTDILSAEIDQTEELSNMLGDLQCVLSMWRAPEMPSSRAALTPSSHHRATM